MSHLKAYKISCDDDDHGQAVAFAERGKDLKGSRADDWCDCEFIHLRVRRAPEFDKYSPGPITVDQYLDEGWFWWCCGCSELVYREDDPIVVDGSAYHGESCARSWLERYQKRINGHRWHESIEGHIEALSAALESRAVHHETSQDS